MGNALTKHRCRGASSAHVSGEQAEPERGAVATSLSPVIEDQFADVQAVDVEFVDLDDAEARAPDR